MEIDNQPLAIAPEPNSRSNPRPAELPPSALGCLKTLASRYVWWKTPEEAMLYPGRVAAQVMNLGTFEEMTQMAEATGGDYLRGVLQRSEVGQLNASSWHYWHYRLGMAEYGSRPVPPTPVRF